MNLGVYINDQETVVLYTPTPGPWIGHGGRWVKAYRALGVKVSVVEILAGEVGLNGLSQDIYKKYRDQAVIKKIKWEYRTHVGNLVGFLPDCDIWEEINKRKKIPRSMNTD